MLGVQISAEEYHASDAIGSSTLKLARKSLAKLKAKLDGRIPNKESAAFDIGTAAHAAILEQDFSGYVCGPDAARNTVRFKEFAAQYPGKIVLKESDYEMVKEMFNAFYRHPLAPNLINNGEPETTFFADIEGVKYKARLDYLISYNGGYYIVDYKTCQSAEFKDFQRAIGDYQYDISAAHYIQIAERCLNVPISDYFWIAQEKEAPFELAVYRMDDHCRKRAVTEVDRLYMEIGAAKRMDVWPRAFEMEIMDIDLNSWKIKEREERV